MRIFIASQSLGMTPYQMADHVSRITMETSNTVPVVAVDQVYNLEGLEGSHSRTDLSHFCLEDFLQEVGNTADGLKPVDGNRIYQLMSQVDTPWLAFDFGQNAELTCIDFIKKLASFSFMKAALQEKTLLFIVPEIFLGYFGRVLNESFNNLPSSPLAVAQKGDIKMLFLSSALEKAFISLPLLSGPLGRLNNLVMRLYRRFGRTA